MSIDNNVSFLFSFFYFWPFISLHFRLTVHQEKSHSTFNRQEKWKTTRNTRFDTDSSSSKCRWFSCYYTHCPIVGAILVVVIEEEGGYGTMISIVNQPVESSSIVSGRVGPSRPVSSCAPIPSHRSSCLHLNTIGRSTPFSLWGRALSMQFYLLSKIRKTIEESRMDADVILG